MALPSSGQLRFSAIAGELGVSLSNVSLRNISSSASFSTPDRVSNFYSYSAGGGGGIKGLILLDACFGNELGVFYLDGPTLIDSTFIYVDKELKEKFGYSGTVSDNEYFSGYDSKRGIQGLKPCDFK